MARKAYVLTMGGSESFTEQEFDKAAETEGGTTPFLRFASEIGIQLGETGRKSIQDMAKLYKTTPGNIVRAAVCEMFARIDADSEVFGTAPNIPALSFSNLPSDDLYKLLKDQHVKNNENRKIQELVEAERDGIELSTEEEIWLYNHKAGARYEFSQRRRAEDAEKFLESLVNEKLLGEGEKNAMLRYDKGMVKLLAEGCQAGKISKEAVIDQIKGTLRASKLK